MNKYKFILQNININHKEVMLMFNKILIFSDQTTGQPRCPVDPYFILPDKCECVDFQVLKMQELPEHVPHGEMPRHMQLYCDR